MSSYKILIDLLLYEGIWDEWSDKIKDVEFIPEMGGRNGVDEILISEKLRDDLKSRVPEVGEWRTILLEYIDTVNMWQFVRQLSDHQNFTDDI